MAKKTVLAILDGLGSDVVCARIGVGLHSVRAARTEGRFPASWYGPLKELCVAEGLECPMHVFNWKTPASAEKAGTE